MPESTSLAVCPKLGGGGGLYEGSLESSGLLESGAGPEGGAGLLGLSLSGSLTGNGGGFT